MEEIKETPDTQEPSAKQESADKQVPADKPADTKKGKHRSGVVLSPGKIIRMVLAAAVLIVILVTGITISRQIARNRDGNATVTLAASLKKVIGKSELSTFSATYNGVAEAYNEKDPEKIDYYVAYQGRVNAGFDFEKIEVNVNESDRILSISLPSVQIFEPTVDFGSIEYIFHNKKADSTGVSSDAYSLCLEDIRRESSDQPAIIELAEQNARNVIRALASPLLHGFYEGYTIEFEEEAIAS